MKTWYLVLLVVVILASAGLFVYFVGIEPKPISKITLSKFENSDVVVNSLFLSISPELEHASIVFLGIDPADQDLPIMNEIFEKFYSKSQQAETAYKAVVIDEGIKNFPGLNAEQFNLHKESQRFVAGLETTEERKMRLLVVVNPLEASPKVPSSLFNLARQSVYKGNPDQVASLIFARFPRNRAEEPDSPIACNTGEEDLGKPRAFDVI